MKPAFLDYAPSAQWTRAFSQQLHVQKLRQIQSRKAARTAEPVTRQLLEKLQRASDKTLGSRQQLLQYENLRMLQRLNQAVGSLSDRTP